MKLYNKNEVIIVDSGISKVSDKYSIIGGINLIHNNENMSFHSNYNDDYGHGTFCATVINNISETDVYAIKILNQDGNGSSQALVRALEHIKEIKDIRLVNLSVATVIEKYKDNIYTLCEKLYKSGKIIVCSLSNGKASSFPAECDYTIGVGGKNFEYRQNYWFNSSKKIQCVADATPLYVPTPDGEYEMFGGTSKATALMSGLISKILKSYADIPINDLLIQLELSAIKTEWTEEETKNPFYVEYNKIEMKKKIVKTDSNYNLLHIVEEVLINVLHLTENQVQLLYEYKIPNPKIYLQKRDYYKIIYSLEKKLNIMIDYNKIDYNTFCSIYNICELINV